MPTFREYRPSGADWITVMDTEFYPDYIDNLEVQYGAVLERFRELVGEASDSTDLLRRIVAEKAAARIELLKVFNRYVSPPTSVEMLRKVRETEDTIRGFGKDFRDLSIVREKLASRPDSDETLMVTIYLQSKRGKKGYDLTEAFFTWFEITFPNYTITGPRGAGRDVILSDVLPDFRKRVPADFLIKDSDSTPLVVGFARYDSDRGGSQEDDRVSGNRDKVTEIARYNAETGQRLKILFVNDGPGLLLGSMWRDYSEIESDSGGIAMVCTLKMLDERVTEDWLTR